MPHSRFFSDQGAGGLWATQDQELSETVPMFGQGQFELLTPDQMLDAVESDGKPRHTVCQGDSLSALCEDGEFDVSDGLILFLKLDPSCFLYYMNACDSEDDAKENVKRSNVFFTKSPSKETVSSLLVDAQNGVAFSLNRAVKKGEQLLHYFPTRAGIKRSRLGNAGGVDGAGVETGGDTISSPGRSTRASARAARTTTS